MNTTPKIHIIEKEKNGKKEKQIVTDYGDISMNQCEYQNLVPKWVRFIESVIPHLEIGKNTKIQFAYSLTHLSFIIQYQEKDYPISFYEKWNCIYLHDFHPIYTSILEKNKKIGDLNDYHTFHLLKSLLQSSLLSFS